MRFLLLTLTLLGIIASSLALREHYRPYGESPCSINEHWDCGVVNHSPYAVIAGVPVAVLGILGYILMAALAARRYYRPLLAASLAGLAFSIYLARIEANVLGVWCIYCVASLVIVSLLTLTSLVLCLIPRRS